MKNLFKILLSVLMLSVSIEIQPAPFDTGMITLKQPNDVTFVGRIWGDEFIYWAETENGYRFVHSVDGWYYYATLDQNGEYTPTNYKVGIDSPPASSYQLERTQARLDEIAEQIEQFNEQIELNREWFAQEQSEAQGQPVTLKVGIILIEFSDLEHYKTTEPPNNRPNGYFTADFDSMMFSYNYWNDPQRHPEEEELFGSFRDYWHQISRGKLKIEGRVVNPTDENGVPKWLKASGTRGYYFNQVGGWELAIEAYQLAIDSGYISENPSDSNYFHKIGIVYAREAIEGIMTIGGDLDGIIFYLPERCGPDLLGGGPLEKSFTHIGLYAHEFGHTIGLNDEYIGGGEDGSTDLYNFCLMAWGSRNGPDRKGACPSTLSPYYRIRNNWVSPDTLTVDEDNFIVEYDYLNPELYCIVPVDATNEEHYIIETKKREGFDLYIPSDPIDTVDQTGRLIIWQHNTHSDFPMQNYTDRIRIIPADNIRNEENQLSDFFPSDFSFNNNQDFNDITTPSPTINETHPYFNQPGDPAHFALNGIQKLENGNTLINEIRLHHPLLIINQISGGWQMVSVPHVLTDYSVQAVFPTRYPNSNVYNSNYQIVTTLENGPGYWAKFYSGQQDLVFQGVDVISFLEIPVVTGWQLTGSISYSIPLSNVHTNPPGIISGTIYRFDGTYIPVTDYIKPGIGYWVKTSASGFLILDKNAEPSEIEEIKFDDMDKFTVSDAEGNTQTLYVSNIEIDTSIVNVNMEMPPLFPELSFDSRFEYGELVKKVSADSGLIDLNILVQTSSFPVNLSWEINPENGIDYSFIGDSSTGKVSSILAYEGNTSFSQLNNNRIQLIAKVNMSNSSTNLPTEYALLQNYPNPFNPVTTIKYDLPKAGDVSLVVYDILGREVKELVNAKQQAGRYEVKWDASKVASGVYIYQLSSSSFVNSKKMILLK